MALDSCPASELRKLLQEMGAVGSICLVTLNCCVNVRTLWDISIDHYIVVLLVAHYIAGH